MPRLARLANSATAVLASALFVIRSAWRSQGLPSAELRAAMLSQTIARLAADGKLSSLDSRSAMTALRLVQADLRSAREIQNLPRAERSKRQMELHGFLDRASLKMNTLQGVASRAGARD